MKIWLINQYNMPPEYGHLNRHFNFGKYLYKIGHEPTVFVGSFLHNTKIQMIDDESKIQRYMEIDYPYYFIKTCDYSRNRFQRAYAMYEFYRNLLREVKSFDKPDIILGSSAHPLSAIAAIKLGKKYGCQSVVEIRDLWPESFVAYGILKKNNPILKVLYQGEKWIYRNADKIIFTMAGGKDYIIEKGWHRANNGAIDIKKVFHINNGVDLEAFNYNKNKYQIIDEDLDNSETFKVVYTGSIRAVNKVDLLLDIAKVLEKEKIVFLIWGTGDEEEKLKKRIKKENIKNVLLKGFTDKKNIPYILSKADLNIAPGETIPLFKFGVSPNKLFDYAASGKPSLWTIKPKYSLIEEYNAGIEIENYDVVDIANIIIRLKNLRRDEYEKYCANAKRLARDYDYSNLTKKMISIFHG